MYFTFQNASLPFHPRLVPHLRSLSWLRARAPSVRAARHPRASIPPSRPRPPLPPSSASPLPTPSSFIPTPSVLPLVPGPSPNGVLSPTDPPSLLFRGSQLGIVRQLEMLNVLIGYEQANQYAIVNELGQSVGYIVEQDTLGRSLLRNFLHTHRPMHATVLDTQGQPILNIHRPFNWINSTITISRADTSQEIGTVEQEWHLWRRRYNLFRGNRQFARIDAPFMSWEFVLTNELGLPNGVIDRNFSGFGREIFTDTGHYAIHFSVSTDHFQHRFSQYGEELGLDERAVALAAAVTIDFDYFSRDRGGIMPMGGIWIPGVWGGGDEE